MRTHKRAMGRPGGGLRSAWMIAALAMVTLAAPGRARAQLADGCTGRVRERVEQYLEETDRILAESRRVVEQSEGERARRILAMAAEAQAEARRALNAGQCAVAARRSEHAREQARVAARTAREDQGDSRLSLETMERSRRILDRAAGALGECKSDAVETLLTRAREQLEQAESAQAEGHAETALRLAQSCERLVQEAIRQCDRGGGPGGDGRVERELERTDAFLARAQPIVAAGGNEQATNQYEHAVEAQERAREFWSQGRGEPALRLTRQAQKFLRRAIELAGGGHASDEAAARAIEATQALYERVEPRVRESGDAAAVQTLALGAEHLDTARQLADGDVERSLAEAKVARNLIRRAGQLAGLPGDALE